MDFIFNGTDVAQRCDAMEQQGFAVAFAIYQRSERDFLSALFGESLTFVLLNVPEELLAEKINARTTQKAQSKGMTLTQYINAFHPGNTVDVVSKSVQELISVAKKLEGTAQAEAVTQAISVGRTKLGKGERCGSISVACWFSNANSYAASAPVFGYIAPAPAVTLPRQRQRCTPH